VKFLVDENLSPLVAAGLRDAGHQASHAADVGMRSVADTVLVAFAAENGLVLVSADTDFGTLLAASGARTPSVVLVRRTVDRRAAAVLALLLENLDQVEAALAEGAVVVLEDARVRVRRLPLL
jgi:predicted nuclease of predicted toxin-antitoxin system